jgi:hypothetical protein
VHRAAPCAPLVNSDARRDWRPLELAEAELHLASPLRLSPWHTGLRSQMVSSGVARNDGRLAQPSPNGSGEPGWPLFPGQCAQGGSVHGRLEARHVPVTSAGGGELASSGRNRGGVAVSRLIWCSGVVRRERGTRDSDPSAAVVFLPAPLRCLARGGLRGGARRPHLHLLDLAAPSLGARALAGLEIEQEMGSVVLAPRSLWRSSRKERGWSAGQKAGGGATLD